MCLSIPHRTPKSRIDQGACSREDPQPKLSPVTKILAPVYGSWLSTKSGLGALVTYMYGTVVVPIKRQTLASWRIILSLLLLSRKARLYCFFVTPPLSTSTYRVVAQFEESGHAKTGALNGLQKLFGNDHVRVHVLNVQFCGNSLCVWMQQESKGKKRKKKEKKRLFSFVMTLRVFSKS